MVAEHIAAAVDGHEDLYFHVVRRGGAWTMAHVGVAVDSIRGEARGVLAKQWCDTYAYPKSQTFACSKYSLEGATLFAREFCRRSTFFLRMALEGPAWLAHVYPADADAAYRPDPEFAEFVEGFPAESEVRKRADALGALRPRVR